MSALQDDIMIEIEGVVRDYLGSGNPILKPLMDAIGKKIEPICDKIEHELEQKSEEVDSMEDEYGDIENERDEAMSELEDIQYQAEIAAMVKQFWYYAEKTTTV